MDLDHRAEFGQKLPFDREAQFTRNPSRLKVESDALKIRKIQMHRLGVEVKELRGASGAARGFYLAGDGLEWITPG
ncbi:hypothetical protein QTI51_26790 [Variovorax sp. J22G73]|uniref:hypothetical protein n=1 Tax=unclassified Variovorax TaxID=663243 RepID=UPI00257597D1|nr:MULTISPECIES: hypothetical protein [unclassified Variovorax]MDM0008406.1 hypothetical protein [Variovorax sp. J22R203]MDM0100914.1 hypothetical protein [Variovorax sp. J22G73]